MQRIDENTYIDDTLVTCAEYQLFIDEMREQGKYYQPDHWTSYQFSEGKALEPTLGVRQSDVVAFCEWVARRENNGWMYRLPTKEEATQFPMKASGKTPSGYWVLDIDNRSQFAWIGSVPVDARVIVFDLDFAQSIARARNRAIRKAHTRVRSRALDLDLMLVSVTYLSTDLALSFHRDATSEIAFELAQFRDLAQSCQLPHSLILARDLAQNIPLDVSRNHNLDRVLDLYIDIFTLQERIAGRSPAFEGIRLVKERIR